MVRLLASNSGESGSILDGINGGIVPDDAAGRQVFSGIFRFPHPFIPALIHTHFVSSSSARKTSMLRAAQISPPPHNSSPNKCRKATVAVLAKTLPLYNIVQRVLEYMPDRIDTCMQAGGVSANTNSAVLLNCVHVGGDFSQRYDGNTARLARRSDEALGVRVSVARTAPSLLDTGRFLKLGWTEEHRTSRNLETGPRVTTPREDRPLILTAVMDRSASSRVLTEHWNTKTGVTLPASTVRPASCRHSSAEDSLEPGPTILHCRAEWQHVFCHSFQLRLQAVHGPVTFPKVDFKSAHCCFPRRREREREREREKREREKDARSPGLRRVATARFRDSARRDTARRRVCWPRRSFLFVAWIRPSSTKKKRHASPRGSNRESVRTQVLASRPNASLARARTHTHTHFWLPTTEHTTRLTPRRTWLDSRQGHPRIFACGNRPERCRLSTDFLCDIPFPPPLHSGAAPYSLRSILIGSLPLERQVTIYGQAWRHTDVGCYPERDPATADPPNPP
ncbi:hypothetical protein PR048_028212 [Dryococelus australis]|uniref:Uncharacterized protein n=1 Tax=Dryococelus australis TaxID=614101 RepID=A0ABQ9GIN8_9NEOP|nr:hypothetical protein PR048_028212 [Dryococelus australis]